MPLETSPESPVPVRTVLQLVGGWIGKLGRVWVEGQIAEATKRGGTVYLTLRDPVAAVSTRVTCARAVFEACDPQVGSRVVIFAKPDFNSSRGSFALAALEIRAVGLGELLARLERLRKSLAAEGLFSAERKRPLPFLPHLIGLVCGRDSAAERDVLHNAGRRWPAVRFRVEQVPVQGAYAVSEVMAAVRRLDADSDVDVIIVARGGGSVEDLLPFSDEALVRAVAACRTPVVSAIGHEQDTPLLDYVADLRASTPTDAAKRVVPDVSEQLALVTQLRDRARRAIGGWLSREQSWLAGVQSRPALADPVREIDRQSQGLEALLARARTCLDSRLARATDDVAHTRARLLALSPASTLKRGYAIAAHESGAVVRSASEVADAETLTLRFAEDQLKVRSASQGGLRPPFDPPGIRSQLPGGSYPAAPARPREGTEARRGAAGCPGRAVPGGALVPHAPPRRRPATRARSLRSRAPAQGDKPRGASQGECAPQEGQHFPGGLRTPSTPQQIRLRLAGRFSIRCARAGGMRQRCGRVRAHSTAFRIRCPCD